MLPGLVEMLPVVEMLPLTVVEILPLTVVEMLPANAVAVIAKVKAEAQSMD